MYKYDSMRRNAGTRTDAGGPISGRRLRHDEATGITSDSGMRCTHVASVLRALQAMEFPERDIEVVLETDEALVVFVTPLLLTCAIGNLLHDAVRFSDDGSRITVRSSTLVDGVCIQVEHECDRRDPGPSATVWLTAAGRMAEAMRGALSIEHRAGSGLTFTLALPFHTGAALDRASSQISVLGASP